MRQINNSKLTDAIGFLNQTNELSVFIQDRKNKILAFQANNAFGYTITYSRTDNKTKSKKKHKRKLTYTIKINDPFDQYLKLFSGNIEKIITCDQIQLLDWKKKFDKIDFSRVKPEMKKGFFGEILNVLYYKGLRSGSHKLLFKFYSSLDVKACVYCNSQHVILLKSLELARLQADHNLPKAKYPCFALTLANLYPSCNNCNHLKSEKDVNYYLYYTKTPVDELKFELDKNEIAKFLLNQLKEEDLTIKFMQGSTKLNEVLNIEDIYKNHSDYASDLLRKYKIYNDSYVTQLTSSFSSIFGNNSEQLNRMIFGTTLQAKDINQKVFSKLIYDLKLQLDNLNKK